MRYYTKEWYELMSCWGLGDSFRKIPDGTYTDSDIRKIYDKKLKKEISDDRRSYNSEPFVFPVDDLLTDDAFDPEEWLYLDETFGEMKRPDSAEEVREHLAAEYQEQLEEYKNRPPFDPTETIELFRTVYRSNLRNLKQNYPEWLIESVDHRLIALGYLPESAYTTYRKEIQKKKRKWNAINKAAEKKLSSQDIPESMQEALQLHDASLLSLKKRGRNLVMLVAKDGYWPYDDTPYRRVTFENAEVLEKETLHVRKYPVECNKGFFASNISFLYSELYYEKGCYEAHMMFVTSKGLRYLTVRCSGILFQDGVETSGDVFK